VANSLRDSISKKTHHRNRAGGVAQGEGPEFKSQYSKKKKKKNIYIYIYIHTHIYIYIAYYKLYYVLKFQFSDLFGTFKNFIVKI
jgi:hypothetical protein